MLQYGIMSLINAPQPSITSLTSPISQHQSQCHTMSSTTLLLSLLVLPHLLIFTACTPTSGDHRQPTVAKPTKATTDFIWSSCRATRYPALCYHSLATFASQIQQSQRQLALTSLAVSVTKARSAADFVSKLSKTKGMKHREVEAIKDCVDTMGDSVDQLCRSFQELGRMGRVNGEEFMFHMSNVQTWVSAALTDDTTCMDGLSINNPKIKAGIQMRLTHVAQLTSNALALVNRFASRH